MEKTEWAEKVKGVVLPSLALKVARTRLPFRTAHSLPTLHWSCPIPLAAFFALFNLVFWDFFGDSFFADFQTFFWRLFQHCCRKSKSHFFVTSAEFAL